MEQMDDYVNIDVVYQNRDGCRPGKLETDRGMKDRSRHKLSAPIVYSLLGFSILLSAVALSTAVILNFRMADPGFPMELSQWKMNDLPLCPCDWIPFSKHCYHFSSRINHWMHAQSSCTSMGAYLVVINNADEQAFLRSNISVSHWIGLSDALNENIWRWVDGTNYYSSVKFWRLGEPNGRDLENCVEMKPGGYWNDVSCNAHVHWICEKPAL